MGRWSVATLLGAWHHAPMSPGEYRTIGIIGGGTAGYLTALAFRKHLPHLRVTLIESPTIPIIGVGEGTTPIMVKFMHSYLEKDVHELFRRVQPTWKLGVRFDWGLPGDYAFNYAFHPGHVLDAHYYGATSTTTRWARCSSRASGCPSSPARAAR